MSTKKLKNCVLILIILIIGTCYSHALSDRKYQIPEIGPISSLDDSKGPNGHPKDPKDISKETEEDILKRQVEEKMEENLKLKEEIENKLKYIKILLVTGVIMLAIIIAILIKVCFCKKKKKTKLKNSSAVELHNTNKKKINSNNVNNEIEDSSYNILNSSLKNLSNISSNDISLQNNSSSDNNISDENVNNLESNKNEISFNENVNDDNKTLTNNPDIFIQSKTDKILYQPYSNEEIYNSDQDKK